MGDETHMVDGEPDETVETDDGGDATANGETEPTEDEE